jgi:hypothetical protein
MEGVKAMQLQAMVRDMDESMRRHKALKTSNFAEFRAKVSEENKFLYDAFPPIFEMHISGKLDETFFEMLRLRRKIELGEITQDEGDKAFGQKIFDRFVAPVINKDGAAPTKPMSYSEYYEQFK